MLHDSKPTVQDLIGDTTVLTSFDERDLTPETPEELAQAEEEYRTHLDDCRRNDAAIRAAQAAESDHRWRTRLQADARRMSDDLLALNVETTREMMQQRPDGDDYRPMVEVYEQEWCRRQLVARFGPAPMPSLDRLCETDSAA